MMYERFTDRARKVMQLANQEAQRLNHEYVGTEHILLGLVKEGSGIAVYVLRNLNVDLRRIRLEIENIVKPGPDMVTMGKLPLTPRAKKVIEHSIEEARNLKRNYIGTEHLLLGLLREQEGMAAMILMNLGAELTSVRREILNNEVQYKLPSPLTLEQIEQEIGNLTIQRHGYHAEMDRLVAEMKAAHDKEIDDKIKVLEEQKAARVKEVVKAMDITTIQWEATPEATEIPKKWKEKQPPTLKEVDGVHRHVGKDVTVIHWEAAPNDPGIADSVPIRRTKHLLQNSGGFILEEIIWKTHVAGRLKLAICAAPMDDTVLPANEAEEQCVDIRVPVQHRGKPNPLFHVNFDVHVEGSEQAAREAVAAKFNKHWGLPGADPAADDDKSDEVPKLKEVVERMRIGVETEGLLYGKDTSGGLPSAMPAQCQHCGKMDGTHHPKCSFAEDKPVSWRDLPPLL